RVFKKHGSKITFAARLLPAVRTYISLPAGIGSTPIKTFIVYSFAGSLIWNLLLVYFGIRLGENWKNIEVYSPILDGIAVVAVTSFIIWFIWTSNRFKKKAHKPT
ncbi:MAG: VTT domain-containing protein, partial [Thermoproteota archaeon]|nr:VTT domain-containing protein [Thermoproteota archaeon]